MCVWLYNIILGGDSQGHFCKIGRMHKARPPHLVIMVAIDKSSGAGTGPEDPAKRPPPGPRTAEREAAGAAARDQGTGAKGGPRRPPDGTRRGGQRGTQGRRPDPEGDGGPDQGTGAKGGPRRPPDGTRRGGQRGPRPDGPRSGPRGAGGHHLESTRRPGPPTPRRALVRGGDVRKGGSLLRFRSFCYYFVIFFLLFDLLFLY
jgi:hypothetical protein